MRKLISVLNDSVAPWIKWKTGLAYRQVGLHAPALITIIVSTKQPLNR